MKKWHILTLRDFYTSREKMILIAIIFLLEIPFCFSVGESLIWAYIMVYILAIMGMHTDDDQGIYRLFDSMPVSRKTLVRSRYAASLVIVGMCLTVLALMSWVFINFDIMTVNPGFGLSDIFSLNNYFLGLFLVLLFMAVSFPFYFKWGYSRGMTLGAAATGLVLAIFIGTFYVAMGFRYGTWALSSYIKNPDKNHLTEFLAGVGTRAFQELGDLTIGIMMLVFITAAGFLSYRISMKIFLSRDL